MQPLTSIDLRRASGPMLCILLLLVVGCTPSSDSAKFTVEYYLADDAERNEKLRQCANDPGALAETRECVNAQHAEARKGIGSYRELPPIGLVENDPRLKKQGGSDQP